MRTFHCAHDHPSPSQPITDRISHDDCSAIQALSTRKLLIRSPPTLSSPLAMTTALSKDVHPYIASVNPPRKAKRPRLETDPVVLQTHSTTTTAAAARPRPQLLPKGDITPHKQDDSPEQDSSDDEEDDYDPVVPTSAPKRRGRKPGPLSRSARESQRKLNHSRIEKARRTKINETLSTLSNLVNEAEKQKSPVREAPAEKEKAKGEKEFKLDVLVKTVSYIQELIQKVQVLEIRANASTCARCSQPPSSVSSAVGSPPSPAIKRKRAQTDHGDNNHEVTCNTATRPSSLPPPSLSPPTTALPSRRLTSASPALLPVAASPSLPPISSWLPHPYLDPSSLPSMSSSSPDFKSHSINPSSHLPTPPHSGSFRTPLAHPTQILPALSLPGPAHPSLASYSSFSQDDRRGVRIPLPSRRLSTASTTSTSSTFVRRDRDSVHGRGVSQSPSVSPSWTPEDESAASLLLQMSSSPTTSRIEKRRKLESPKPFYAETPSSLLGIVRTPSQKETA